MAENNAQLRRHSPQVAAADAERILNDPRIQAEFDAMERELVDAIAATPLDGTPEAEECEREVCRTLRTVRRLRKGLTLSPQLDDLRAAQFKPRNPDNEDDS